MIIASIDCGLRCAAEIVRRPRDQTGRLLDDDSPKRHLDFREKQAMSRDRTMPAVVVIATVFASICVLAFPSGEAAPNNERVSNRDLGCAVLDELSQVKQL